MRYQHFRSIHFLLVLFLAAGCSNGERSAQEPEVAETRPVTAIETTRHCFRNEYPFEGEPSHADVELLNLEITGDRVVGEYNWLPAFKNRRVGRFQGSGDGQSVTANYEYTQEGQSEAALISISLEPEQAVVAAENPELGLNATITRVDC